MLHIGLEENLHQALADISAIKNEHKQEFNVLSLVSSGDSSRGKENQDGIVYLSLTEMKQLRTNYSIENNANHFYIIDKEGIVFSSPYFTSSFNKLKAAVQKIPTEEKITRWKPSPIFWRNLGLFSFFSLLLSGFYMQRKRAIAKKEKQRRQVIELELKSIRSQMNPHFLFNALSSIQNLIRKKR